MDDRQTQEQRNQDHKALATADLAGTEPRDEAWAKSHNGENGHASGEEEEHVALLPKGDCDRLRGDWDSIQAGFVDEPRSAVERADNLVATTMKQLAETFAAERSKLEGAWDRGGDVSTEDLRVALQRYRSFFNRLLTI
ncbi:MAG TPA: hypothetical protein VF835_03215 [Rhizomicrobium sp.]